MVAVSTRQQREAHLMHRLCSHYRTRMSEGTVWHFVQISRGILCSRYYYNGGEGWKKFRIQDLNLASQIEGLLS